MSSLRIATTGFFAATLLIPSLAAAQQVAMAGQYSDVSDLLIQIPQNPPVVDCDSAQGDARCFRWNQNFFGFPFGNATEKPQVGVKAARLIDTVGGGGGGLAVGDPFEIPPSAFRQNRGLQARIIPQTVAFSVRQVDTAFTFVAPGSARTKGNTTLTRRFSAMNWSAAGNGQNNGLSGPAAAGRLAASTTINATIPGETLAMTYTPGVHEFGGTAAILLGGTGRVYRAGPNIDGIFTAGGGISGGPFVLTRPIRNGEGLSTENGAGWDYSVSRVLAPGQFRWFPVTPHVVAPVCTDPNPGGQPIPSGCNEINGFDTNGIPVGSFPGATSVDHMFAWTTGTVSIVRTAIRNGNTQTDTVTGMGYDTTVMSTGGAVTQRNVGLIAGSYAIRTFDNQQTELNPRMVGMDLTFTPEPTHTSALLIGLGALGGLSARRTRTLRD